MKEHNTNNGADCWCEPQIIVEGDSRIFVHQKIELKGEEVMEINAIEDMLVKVGYFSKVNSEDITINRKELSLNILKVILQEQKRVVKPIADYKKFAIDNGSFWVKGLRMHEAIDETLENAGYDFSVSNIAQNYSDAIKGCGVCGSEKVYIRGKYPKEDNRLICPCCAYERLEQIHEISGKDYGQAYTDNSNT